MPKLCEGVSTCPRYRQRLVLVLLLLVTLGLRVVPLAQHRFHEDEALYSSWALLTREDPALISAPVDKPPLHLYLLAGTFRLLGASEVSARLPSLFASVASVAILFALGRALWDEPTALAAAALYAASPFAILFSPTVFTDPLLVLWMLLWLWAVVAGRPALAGVALGLAYATKQQAVLLAPLVIAMGVHARQTIRPIKQPYGRQALKAIGSFLLVFAGATWWDSLRWHVQPGFWDRSLASYGGLTLVPMGAWPARLRDWTELVGYVFASPILNALLLTLFLGQGIFTLRMTSVFWSLLTWMLTVALARRWWGWRAALLTGAALACGFWPLMMARVGLRATTLPALLAASALDYDHALAAKTTRRAWRGYVLAGGFLGASLYTYMASRGMPALYLTFLIALALFDRRTLERGYFNEGYIRHLWDEHSRGRRNHEDRLWELWVLEMWHRKYIDVNPAESAAGSEVCPSAR